MKPNILGLGFYSHDIPQSCLSDLRVQLEKRSKFVRVMIRDTTRKRAIIIIIIMMMMNLLIFLVNKYDMINTDLPPLRQTVSLTTPIDHTRLLLYPQADDHCLSPQEYVGIIQVRERERGGNIIYYYFIVGCRDDGKKYLHHETVSLITINNIVSSPFPPLPLVLSSLIANLRPIPL